MYAIIPQNTDMIIFLSDFRKKGTFLRISTIGKRSFLTLIPPLKSLHAVSLFFPPILAVRTRGSEEGGGGGGGRWVGGRGMARWSISTILVKSLATLLGFFW